MYIEYICFNVLKHLHYIIQYIFQHNNQCHNTHTQRYLPQTGIRTCDTSDAHKCRLEA